VSALAASKDRWHQLADAIAASNMRESDKSVYRFLLDKADYATAELPPKFTPPRKVIARKTSVSLRQVSYAIEHLKRHGWLTATGTTGPGKTLVYTLLAGNSCDCTGRVHDQRQAPPLPPSPTVTGGNGRQSTVATFGHRSGLQRTGATLQVRPRVIDDDEGHR
jgi:hypothetical protein